MRFIRASLFLIRDCTIYMRIEFVSAHYLQVVPAGDVAFLDLAVSE